jgi:hypothetical protein
MNGSLAIELTGDASEVNEDFIEASKSLWQKSKSNEVKRSLGNLVQFRLWPSSK